jgi:predicted glycoside hydrolase/deacetylase ChbG (UPF0249 family)
MKSSVNKAIVESFNKGIINSTTIMANLPFFEEAVELAYRNQIAANIGIHLHLVEGCLLTSETLAANLFHNENHLKHKKNRRSLFLLSINEKTLIYEEFAAQIEKVKKAGIHITHVDTHHHIHEIWPMTRIILALLKSYNIPSMRILNNLNTSTKFYKSGYRKLVNMFLRINHTNFTDYFGNQLEVISLLRNHPSEFNTKKIEVMVHPDFNTQGIMIDRIKDREYNFEYPDDFSKLISADWQTRT